MSLALDFDWYICWEVPTPNDWANDPISPPSLFFSLSGSSELGHVHGTEWDEAKKLGLCQHLLAQRIDS